MSGWITLILGPAVITYILTVVMKHVESHRRKIHLAKAITAEIDRNWRALERFIPVFEAEAPSRLSSGFFIPIDKGSAQIFELVKDELLEFPDDLVSALAAYYSTDRCINELLEAISSKEFPSYDAARKQTMLDGTIATLKQGLSQGRDSLQLLAQRIAHWQKLESYVKFWEN